MFDSVVLIGGSASVGKTTLAASLAGRLAGAEVVHVDEVRRNHPDGMHHLDRPGVWDLEPSVLLKLLLEETASLGRPCSLIARVRAAGGPAIIGGEGIEPRPACEARRKRRSELTQAAPSPPAYLPQSTWRDGVKADPQGRPGGTERSEAL